MPPRGDGGFIDNTDIGVPPIVQYDDVPPDADVDAAPPNQPA